MQAVVYIINIIPLPVPDNKSPYEVLYNKQPSLSHLRVKGCLCFATNLVKGDKICTQGKKGSSTWICSHSKGV